MAITVVWNSKKYNSFLLKWVLYLNHNLCLSIITILLVYLQRYYHIINEMFNEFFRTTKTFLLNVPFKNPNVKRFH